MDKESKLIWEAYDQEEQLIEEGAKAWLAGILTTLGLIGGMYHSAGFMVPPYRPDLRGQEDLAPWPGPIRVKVKPDIVKSFDAALVKYKDQLKNLRDVDYMELFLPKLEEVGRDWEGWDAFILHTISDTGTQ